MKRRTGKRIVAVLILIIALVTAAVYNGYLPFWQPEQGESGTAPEGGDLSGIPAVDAGISEIRKYGDLRLDVDASELRELGYEEGDLIVVTIGSVTMEMPICGKVSDVGAGNAACCFGEVQDSGEETVTLAVNMGDMAGCFDIASRVMTGEDPGYAWNWNEGFDEHTAVHIAMSAKQGLADAEEFHSTKPGISLERSEYADLTDAEYANFREVTAGDVGNGMLYRSSSPLNPKYDRCSEAYAAFSEAGIRTIINLADRTSEMEAFEAYTDSAYAESEHIALDMGMDFFRNDFRKKMAEGLRFLAGRDGPYLIHCQMGKDRTGFVLGVLECLMGAGAEEVVADYMVTYYNYYGVQPGTAQYERIAAANIESTLADAFGTESIRRADIDLESCAKNYLLSIGLTEQEIELLKQKLGADRSE